MNTTVIDAESGETKDIFETLLEKRILFLSDHIDDKKAQAFIQKVIYLDISSEEHEKISVFLNVTGCDQQSLFMIYDVFSIIKSPIETILSGTCEQEAVLILAAGTKGMRCATKNSRLNFSPLFYENGIQSSIKNIKQVKNLFNKTNNKFITLLAKHCGKSKEEVEKDLDERLFLTASKCKQYGIVDNLLP